MGKGRAYPLAAAAAKLAAMDESVLAAIARWPRVPAVYGWLSLTARGEWRLRGEPIAHAAMREFIGRNYACDDRGRWFFQNGPQRVYVELELAPWSYRLHGDRRVLTHTGRRPRRLQAAALLDGGSLLLQTELGPGSLDDRDLPLLLPALVDGEATPLREGQLRHWLGGDGDAWLDAGRLGLAGGLVPVRCMHAGEAAARFGFQRQPAED